MLVNADGGVDGRMSEGGGQHDLSENVATIKSQSDLMIFAMMKKTRHISRRNANSIRVLEIGKSFYSLGWLGLITETR